MKVTWPHSLDRVLVAKNWILFDMTSPNTVERLIKRVKRGTECNPGLVVMGGDRCSKEREFESRHGTQGIWIKVYLCLLQEKTENRPRMAPLKSP